MTNQDSVQAPQELVMAVGEVADYVFDFTQLLKSNQTISSATVVASISNAVTIGDPTPNASEIAVDLAAGVDVAIAVGKAVQVQLTGLLARELKLTCTATITGSKARKQVGVLKIEA